MNAKALAAIANDPALFRRSLVIDADGAAVPFKPDAWQESAFVAMDPAWRYAAGRWQGDPPKVKRSWQRRGRGHSKTSDLAIMCAWALCFASRPIRGIAAAGDADQARLLRDAIATLARLNPLVGELLDVQAWRVTNTKTGAILDILSSDVGTSYGQLVDFIAVDEITHWPEGKGEQLWVSLLSTAAKRANCLLSVICNAGFEEHFSARVEDIIATDPAWHYLCLDGPTASWVTPERLAEQQRLLPPVAYDRLHGNRRSSGSGEALSGAQIDAAITERGEMRGGWHDVQDEWMFFCGIDLGLSRNFSACVTIAARARDQKVRLAHVAYWRPPVGGRLELVQVGQEILEICQRFYPWRVYADQWQAQMLAEMLAGAGVPIETIAITAPVLREMATATIELFNSGCAALYPHPELLADLRRARFVDAGHTFRLSFPKARDGSHGDVGSAYFLSVLACFREREAVGCVPEAVAEYEAGDRHSWTARMLSDPESIPFSQGGLAVG